MIGGLSTPGAKPTVSTTSTSFSQRPVEWPARLGSIFAGCSAFMWIVRVKPYWPYCSVIVSPRCVIRFTGPSNVQSNRMLVVSQRMRGLSSGEKLRNLSAASLPAAVYSTRGRPNPPPGGGAGRSPGL